tara:strand:+ start:165 stop:530 length:366 start_codon:yes stop_codon:yes gene_type:complete
MLPALDVQQLGNQLLKLGTHRNKRRIWLDSPAHLRAAGFFPSVRYTAEYNADFKFIILRLDENGKTKVSKKIKGGELLPVIDINNKNISAVFSDYVSHISVYYFNGEISICDGISQKLFHS